MRQARGAPVSSVLRQLRPLARRLVAALAAFALALCPVAAAPVGSDVAGTLAVQQAFAATAANEMTDSCPQDGATAVPTSGRLWVRFANNIATVEGNLELASLVDADGAEVPEDVCTVSMADYELEFGYRQYLFFDVDGLEPGAGYAIVIEAGVTAKNGNVSEQAVRIEFTTAAEGEEAIELAEPEEQAAGSGGGDGTGGGGNEETADEAVGSVTLASWSVAGTADDERRQPYMDDSMAHYAVLHFSANISYYDSDDEAGRSLVDANEALVTLQKADGTVVEGVEVYSLFEEASVDEGIIYLDLEGWLDPLSTYQIVIEPGLQTYWGDVSTQRYVIEFTTDGQLSWGPTLAQLIALVCVIVMLAAGIASQLVRRKRQRGERR